MAEWPEHMKLEGCTELIRIGGQWFGLPLHADEQVQLANLSWVRADRVLIGNEEWAAAWNWSARSLEELSKRASRSPLLYRWFNRLPRENRQLVMPAGYGMLIYRNYVLAERVRYEPLAPGGSKKRKPGEPNWSERAPFDVQFDEERFTEAEHENEQALRDYDHWVSAGQGAAR